MLAFVPACEAPDSPPGKGQQVIAGTSEDYTFEPDPARKYPPVTDPAAPAVKALKAQGLAQSGWDAEPFSCGPACDAEYIYAIFMGRQAKLPTPAEHRFTCPNPETPGEQEEWRCMPYAVAAQQKGRRP